MPPGRLLMNGDMSTDLIDRPDSPSMETQPEEATTNSRPSVIPHEQVPSEQL